MQGYLRRCVASPVTSSHLLSHTRPAPNAFFARRLLPRAPTYNQQRTVAFASDSTEKETSGTITPTNSSTSNDAATDCPYHFVTGYALYAKRPSRPFPPPFLSYPSASFSDPLSTHNRSFDKRKEQSYQGEIIRGITNGDDAVLVSQRFVAAGDGVGAWAQKDRGHAALWSRLILHFWALEAERDDYGAASPTPDPALSTYLQRAYTLTQSATSPPNEWFGTTTASGALLSCAAPKTNSEPAATALTPRLHITQLGDSAVLVVRPSTSEVIHRTTEQWHWFDCPRQLGTNSPDTPDGQAVTTALDIEEGDIVLAITDGVSDNLWEHEIVTNVIDTITAEKRVLDAADGSGEGARAGNEAMRRVAGALVQAAKEIAEDPTAESPFMERAVDEGLAIEGGKLDDISVVAAMCRRRPAG